MGRTETVGLGAELVAGLVELLGADAVLTEPLVRTLREGNRQPIPLTIKRAPRVVHEAPLPQAA